MTAYESVTTEIPSPEFGACALIQDLLPLYAEGEVSPGSRDTIDEHLVRCERCASYLAGAQSVRAQLGRVRTQRADLLMRDRSTRQVVTSGRRLATMIATLALCALGALGSLFVWVGLTEHGSPAALPVGLVLGSLCFASLVMLAQRGEEFSLGRLVPTAALCGLGAFATVLLVMADSPPMKLFSVCGAAVALVGVWMLIVPERREAA